MLLHLRHTQSLAEKIPFERSAKLFRTLFCTRGFLHEWHRMLWELFSVPQTVLQVDKIDTKNQLKGLVKSTHDRLVQVHLDWPRSDEEKLLLLGLFDVWLVLLWWDVDDLLDLETWWGRPPEFACSDLEWCIFQFYYQAERSTACTSCFLVRDECILDRNWNKTLYSSKANETGRKKRLKFPSKKILGTPLKKKKYLRNRAFVDWKETDWKETVDCSCSTGHKAETVD